MFRTQSRPRIISPTTAITSINSHTNQQQQCRNVRASNQIILVCYTIFMSIFCCQIVSAARCSSLSKQKGLLHSGIRLKPLDKAREPWNTGDMLIFSCLSIEHVQTIKCLPDGQWSDFPDCPDPINFTCPELGPFEHGTYNATNSLSKVGTVLEFRCNDEIDTVRYNLTGYRFLKCLPTAKWNHPMPTCIQLLVELNSNSSALILLALIVLLLIIGGATRAILKWRENEQQRVRWNQYFTDYKYSHSKTNVVPSNHEPALPGKPVPVTDL